MRREMSTIIEKYSGYAECWDDVTGAPLIETLVGGEPGHWR